MYKINFVIFEDLSQTVEILGKYTIADLMMLGSILISQILAFLSIFDNFFF